MSKYGYDCIQYNSALEKARKHCESLQNTDLNVTLNNQLKVLENVKLSLRLKTILLDLMSKDGCEMLGGWLRSRTEKITWFDQQTKFGFLTSDEFKKCYIDTPKPAGDETPEVICLRFMESYLNYHKKDLF